MFEINGVSYSGMENQEGFRADTLEEARATAHLLTTQMGQFTAWVQSENVNECHQGTQAGCEICEK